MKTGQKLGVGILCITALVTGAPQTHAAITDGLAGHWTFDETAGSVAADTSGLGNNGSVLPGDAQWTTGQIGGALGYRGPGLGDDYVAVTNCPAATGAFAVSAWVWTDPRNGTWPQSTIVENGLANGGPFGLVSRLKDEDQDFGPLGNSTTDTVGAKAVNDTAALPTGVWQHVGVVAEGTTIKLYRNGALAASLTDYSGALPASPSSFLGIGATLDATGTATGGFWQGKIDDVGVWTNGLSADQMAAVFIAGLAGKSLSQAETYLTAAPVITEQPQSQTHFAGEVISLAVRAAGPGELKYQWKKNSAPISGATNATYTITTARVTDQGQYTVEVSTSFGTTPSAAATVNVQAVGLATGLVGYWKFDETTGTTAVDSSSHHNNGELGNYLTTTEHWVPGQIGRALEFGGPDSLQYVRVPDYPKPTNTVTASLWVYADSRTTWATFLKNWGGTKAGQFHFGLYDTGGQENIYIKQADGKTPNVSEPLVFPLNSWQHVAAVCDGTRVRLYRNGSEVASVTYDGTLVAPIATALGIGAKLNDDGTEPNYSLSPGFWDGKMDDVALWNRGLGPDEITGIYLAGLAGKGALEADAFIPTAPMILAQPANTSAYLGQMARLTVQASGAVPVSYQWYQGNTPIAGATTYALTYGPVTQADNGTTFKVAITNSLGATNSLPATLTVLQRPAATLVSEWKFENNTSDTSGNANDGTASDVVGYVNGVSGKAVRLPGGVTIANVAANNLPGLASDSWSINLWLYLTNKPTSLGYLAGFGPVLNTGAGTARGLLAFKGTDNQSIYSWGNSRDTETGKPYPLNQWAMITMTYDGADGPTNGVTQVFLNGQLIGRNTQVRVNLPADQQQINLCPTSNWSIAPSAGDFDEFTIWKGALTTSQIAALYETAYPVLRTSRAGQNLVLSWTSAATGFTLESAGDVSGAAWNPIVGVTGNSATVPIGTTNTFFRLRK